MLRIGICDDEIKIAGMLENYVLQYAKMTAIDISTEVFSSGAELCESLKQHNGYDLILLDIEMKNGNGIDVGRYIREDLQNESIQIVYVSGKEGYDRLLFEFRPMCFIEKPLKYRDIKDTIDKYRKLYGSNNDIFSITSNYEKYWLDTKRILYLESSDRKVKIVYDDGKIYEYYETLESIYERIKAKGFIMIHKSYVINYRYVHKFGANEVVMANNESLPISKYRKKELAKWQLYIESGGR